ncbi:PhzF family phenazine biosynthesis protein [Rosistilla oblonga]|uniref:PhzF family phenazine biosynthesis protein n=1 Tax=Rosistilla oblonga TaxID=2527990 RepID=UPI003A97582D
MSIRIVQIDAFTDRPFAGNPAAVCLLEQPREVDWMQAVAAEMNLSETAFVRPIDVGYELRWFTPQVEVDLCGHATLAAAHALWTEAGISPNETLRFQTRSGQLTARRDGALIQLDFPATPAKPCDPPAGLIEALPVDPVFVGETKFDTLVVIESEAQLRSLQPDFARLAKIPTRGVIVTCRSESPEFDFLSRFFGPAAGIDEDPVTGSAHCCLAPYWGPQLGKTEMTGYQASSRGGVVKTQIAGDRILLSGAAVTVLRGELV